MGEVSALAEKLNCEVIPADATSVEDLENVFKRSMEVLAERLTLYFILSVCLQMFVKNVLTTIWTMTC